MATRQQLLTHLASQNVWGGWEPDTGIRRDALDKVSKFLDTKHALVIKGIRRCGKSFLLMQILKQILSSGVDKGQTLYVRFDDPTLSAHLDIDTLPTILRIFKEEVCGPRKAYLLFDEIQYVSGWERWAALVADKGDDKLIVTGSSATILSREIGTFLTGRHLSVELWPLNFHEFLRFRGAETWATGLELRGHDESLAPQLIQYLRLGGMPEVVRERSAEVQQAILKQYFDDIVMRDVVTRHEVRNVMSLRRLAVLLLTNSGNLTSVSSLKRSMRVSQSMVEAYLSHLWEAYLVEFVPGFSHSLKAQASGPRKVYAVDTGLRNAVSFSGSEDRGRLAETVVFNELRRRLGEDSVFYWRDKGEVDFVLTVSGRPVHLVQVCFADKPPERELKALTECAREIGVSTATIVSTEGFDEFTAGPCKVSMVPLWYWLASSGHNGFIGTWQL